MQQEKINNESLIKFNGELCPISEVRDYILHYTANGPEWERVSTTVITGVKIEEFYQLQLLGKKLPPGWKETVVQYHERKERVWQIQVIDFKKRQAAHNRMMHICEILEREE